MPFDPTSYAKEKGYKKYYQKGGVWYGRVAGAWKTFAGKEEARQANIAGVTTPTPTTVKRPTWVKPGEQWTSGETEEQHLKRVGRAEKVTLEPVVEPTGTVSGKSYINVAGQMVTPKTASEEANMIALGFKVSEGVGDVTGADLGLDLGEDTTGVVTSDQARAKEREEAKEELEAITPPGTPEFATTYQTLMSDAGISGIQDDINAKKALLRDLEASLRERANSGL
ncbi:unnamed protein product, partial [marine sediment metagenome]